MKSTMAILLLITACESVPERTTKTDWTHCWELCGKGDKLEAVGKGYCLCKGGYRMESEPEKPKAPEEPFSLFEWMGFKN